MRPKFDIAIDFFKRILIEKGFSGNVKWLFRENILVKKGDNSRYKFILNPEENKPNELVETIYEKLKENNQEIFFYTFIKGNDFTYVTIASDDYDFESEEGDVIRKDWNLKFGFSNYWDFGKDEIQLLSETDEWTEMKRKETKDIGPFDYFYMAEYFI